MGSMQHSNLRTFIVVFLVVAVCIAVPFVMPLVSNAFLYPVSHTAEIEASAERHGVDPYMVCAIIRCESGWDENAVSDAGAQGLMQIMPETAQTMVNFGRVDPERFPVDDLMTPATNIEYGCAYLSYLAEEFATPEEIAAAYNAGVMPVRIWVANAENSGADFVDEIEYQETRAYVARVMVSYTGYQASYPNLLPAE